MSHQEPTRASDTKTCSRCRGVKPLSEFTKNTSTRTGRGAYCKACAAEWQREYRQREPERHRRYEENRHRRHGDKIRAYDRDRWHARRSEADRLSRRRFAKKVLDKYGITLEAYDKLVSQPCEICGSSEGIVLDHCHATGNVRGPLCKPCNTGLGHFFDDPARLRAAAEYLESHQ